LIAAQLAGVEYRLGESAAVFEFARRKTLECFGAVFLPELGADGTLHVGDHCLERFFADFGEVARLVDHAAALAAHAEGAGLAGVFAAHGLPKLEEAARFLGFTKSVGDCGPAAAGTDFFHGLYFVQ